MGDTRVLLEMAELGRLPLDEARARILLPTFEAWSEGAAAINALMASEPFRGIMPVTVFGHPGTAEEE